MKNITHPVSAKTNPIKPNFQLLPGLELWVWCLEFVWYFGFGAWDFITW